MPDTKISALTAGDPALGTDQIPVARSGTNVQVTAASIAALSPAGTVTSVGLSGGTTGLTVSGTNPIVASGTLTLAGTLALANGGTGQTTKAAAFNALSPVTSTGDLILGNGSNSNTRLAIGTNAYVLTSNGTTASWQPAAGGGGGVTSFSAGSTGLNPSSTTTGAVTLSGTLGVGSGGTGVTAFATNGQLLIGNGGGYTVATLTAGAGIAITNASGAITIAASGGPTISSFFITTPSGNFGSATPSSTVSKPLVAYTASPSAYGAFFFADQFGGFMVSSATPSAIQIVDSVGGFANYTSGADFSGSLSAYDYVVTCYGMFIYSTGMQDYFDASAAAIASPSVAPFDASSSLSFSNPSISVATSGSTYINTTGPYGIVLSKIGSDYFVQFGSGDFTTAFPSVTSISFTINGSPSSYSAGTDFTSSFSGNSSNGQFSMTVAPINATLTTLLANSFL